jgi:hypothetical protein
MLWYFRALRDAQLLRDYYDRLDPFSVEGEETVESIFAGTAFRPGGLVESLLAGSPARCASEVGPDGRQPPSYDPDVRELRVGGLVMRRYDARDNHHELILKAFQQVGWDRRRVKIPRQLEEPKRLGDTLRQLNKPQKKRPMLIHFGRQGEYIFWESLTEPR